MALSIKVALSIKTGEADRLARALAKTRGLPLLFKGDDFTHTDVISALA